MSDYPIWWDTTLTVYNKFEDPQTQVISWYRTVIDNCFWKYTGDKINIGETVLETNNIICRIPENDLFIEKYEWIQLPNDKKSQYFTLGAGDVIIKGEVDDIVNEYLSGHRSSDLVAKYKNLQGCMEVQQITLNTGVGRNNPHYFVKGI